MSLDGGADLLAQRQDSPVTTTDQTSNHDADLQDAAATASARAPGGARRVQRHMSAREADWRTPAPVYQCHTMSSPYYEVEKILKQRMKNGHRQFLLKWKGFPESENSWEPESNVTADLVSEFEKSLVTSSRGSSGSRKRSSPITLSPPVRKPVCRRTTSAPLVASQPVADASVEVKDEFSLSEEATDEELQFARSVYQDLVAESVDGAIVIRNKLHLRVKWSNGQEDLVPSKFANRLFPHLVIAFYQANLCLQDSK